MDYYYYYDQDCTNENDSESCNSSYYMYHNDPNMVQIEGYVLPIIFAIIFIIGMTGNSLVLYVVARNGTMKTTTNIYLVNLAIADLLFLLFCVPFTAWLYLPPNWIFGQLMCKLTNYLIVVTMSVCIITLTCMSIDRYNAVVHPVKSRVTRTSTKTIKSMVIAWLVSCITFLPITFITTVENHIDHGYEQTFCLEKWPTNDQRKVYTLSGFVLLYIIPMCVIAISYLKMARNLWSSIGPVPISEQKLINRRKVAKLVMTVVIVFGVCHFPIHLVTIWVEFGTVDENTALSFYIIKLIAHCMLYTHSCLNPIVYGFLSENFRQNFKLAFLSCAKKVVPRVFTVDLPHASVGKLKPNSLTAPQDTVLKFSRMRVSNLGDQNKGLLIGEKKNSCYPLSEKRKNVESVV